MTKYMEIMVRIILFQLHLSVVFSTMHVNDFSMLQVPDHFSWTDDTVESRVLFCPNCCKRDDPCLKRDFAGNDMLACCTKHAQPYWTFPEYFHVRHYLNMEFNKTDQIKKTLSANSIDISVYVYSHQFKNMTTFPVNLCQLPSVVEVNLNENDIENIVNVSCINHMDTLILSRNKIRKLESFTFRGCANLRILDLSFNKISYMEPETLNYRPGSLMRVRLQDNQLKSIDVTNVFLNFCFYLVDVSNNNIAKVTNESKQNWTISHKAGGVIKFHNNNFTVAPEPSVLRYYISVAFRYMLMASYNPWFCDCRFEEFSELLKMAHKNFQGIETQIVCAGPPELKGEDLVNISQHQLICKLTLKDICPPRCSCFRQPSETRVVINCTSTGRWNMLKVVPELYNLHIDLSHNSISKVTKYDYLYNTSWIDLSYNQIVMVDHSIFSIRYIKVINLKHNRINSLHYMVQLKDPCKLTFGILTLKCTCDMLWVKNWIERQTQRKCTGNSLNCKTVNGLADISLITKNDLCPKTDNDLKYVILTFTLSLLFFSFFLYTFNYEIYIIYRRIKFNFTQYSRVQRDCEFDIYTSFDVQNDVIRGWIAHDFVKFFENLGYRVCLPPRDFQVGAVHVDQMRRYIGNCRSFIVVLSQSFLDSQFQITEWNQIWNTWKSGFNKNIVIINYDLIKSKDVSQRKLKAFLRLGQAFDFANFEKHLYQDIESSLGLVANDGNTTV